MKLYTIGFTKKSAEIFFNLLRIHGVERLIDIRLNPKGQLAGFAKQADLSYFLSALIDCEYYHLEFLAPTDEILSDFRKNADWGRYENKFQDLMDEREIPKVLDRDFFQEKTCCLLCSESKPEKCHRRLVAERLAAYWNGTEIIHIV